MCTDVLPGLSVVLVHSRHEPATDAIAAAAAAAAAAAQASRDYELVVVEDGVGVGTASSAALLRDPRLPVRVLVHPHARGYGRAVRTGLEAARMPWVLLPGTTEAVEPRALRTLAAAAASADVVIGRRAARPRARPARRRPAPPRGPLVLLRREALDRVVLRTGGRLVPAEMLIRCPDGVRVAERCIS
jgi:glycosyltransferase involved in cell wall biosynthesis